ncbi:hypothetical protein F3Y22_tig00112215pilonHSYRG00326 [Hibiscus syriacus]|uniref:RNase H type-1 domain-containing protein n=1 Tax=Hibiscus syriacus TaxID=106335 RepID=A0A6A2Y2Z4_HIBSY|nr:hypothetical protein F3Y22_tig00112215pilonHSYRG00326 [Hibiscus syriacus]
MAAVHAVKFAVELGFHSVFIEEDSRGVIAKLQYSSPDLSEISASTWEVKIISNQIHACVFQFISRDENKVAHLLVANSNLGPREVEIQVAENSRLIDPL